MPLVLFNPEIRPYQVLPHRARVDLGAMAMKGCSVFPKASALLGPHHQTVKCRIQDTCWEVLPLCRGAVSVFYSPSRLGNRTNRSWPLFRSIQMPRTRLGIRGFILLPLHPPCCFPWISGEKKNFFVPIFSLLSFNLVKVHLA